MSFETIIYEAKNNIGYITLNDLCIKLRSVTDLGNFSAYSAYADNQYNLIRAIRYNRLIIVMCLKRHMF